MRLFALLFVVAPLILWAGCESVVDPAPLSPQQGPGTISGIIRLDPDVKGTIEGTIVQLFNSHDDVHLMQPARTLVVGEGGYFEFNNVYTGMYYLGVWKDNDNNGLRSSGDFTINQTSSDHCSCQVSASCTTHLYPCICVVP